MTRNRIISIVGIVLLLLLIGWAASRVGNVSIRRVKPTDTSVALRVTEPLLPGVATIVHWTAPTSLGDRAVRFSLRTSSDTAFVGPGSLGAGQASIKIPCVEGGVESSLIMADATTGEVLGSSTLTLLPPGPDCI